MSRIPLVQVVVALVWPSSVLVLPTGQEPPQTTVITVSRDNTVITRSATVSIAETAIVDADGDGVIHVAADGVTLDFRGAMLNGAARGRTPDTFAGVGLRITGKNVTIRGLSVRGYKAGIHATGADGLTIEDCDLSGNFRQRLRSTPAAEDGGDWLWPHRNDNNEWLTNYGAGLYVEDAKNVTIRRVRAREGQNGIILDRVTDSKVYDNDCSFLSGWGLAMWRSSGNVITRNAFDFCVRGYSHGVYNRGQDSAGILMFEQCSDNLIAENSVTHGGDGIFGFGGQDALGEHWLNAERARLRKELGRDNVDDAVVYPADVIERARRNGNNRNLIINNDLSHAPAHGLEMTFSFDNRIIGNRMADNAICGIWGGYSQSTLIAGNEFIENGEMAYGLERGGVNIEHGRDNLILGNTFRGNKAGVHLWWDADDGLMLFPWSKANDPAITPGEDGSIPLAARPPAGADGASRMLPSIDNVVADNLFEGDVLAVHLRDADATVLRNNRYTQVGRAMDASNSDVRSETERDLEWTRPDYTPLGETQPVGARASLRGREHIIVTEWGPYDWEKPYLQRLADAEGGAHVYRLLGKEPMSLPPRAVGDVVVTHEGDGASERIVVSPAKPGTIAAYTLSVHTESDVLTRDGLLIATRWSVKFFPWTIDPRENLDGWHNEAALHAVTAEVGALDLPFGMGGPSNLASMPQNIRDARLGGNRFGTIATTTLTFPAGKWRVITRSDDGIRVWVGDTLLIDDWTWHGPTEHRGEIAFDRPTEAAIRVEHFEIDGYAVLSLRLERVD